MFKSESYTIYEKCVEDRIYGEPAAWALRGGKIVLSPVRAVEEFCWRDTPWGDMTRIQNRTERWDAPEDSAYPKLHTEHNVINAAFSLATDIMCQNRNKKYALPGQEGLMNAAVFQREGEGFGSWVRDTCHAAFRCRIYLHRMKPGSRYPIFLNMDLIMVLTVLPCRRLQHGIII